MSTANFKILDKAGNPIPRMYVRCGYASQTEEQAWWDGFTNNDGSIARELLPDNSYRAWVNTREVNPIYLSESFRYTLPQTEQVLFKLNRAPLTKLSASGLYFFAGDKRVHLKGNTDFLLYKRYLDGEDITPILSQRSALGSKYVRVIGMVDSFSHWYPQEYGDVYYDRLDDFRNLLDSYGLYMYFTVFADTKIVMPDLQQQKDHLSRISQFIDWGELVNEQGQHLNSVEREAFSKPEHGIWCSGSFGENIPPDPPHWDFIDFHSKRQYPSSVKDINNVDYVDNQGRTRLDLNKPIGMGEPLKFGPGREMNTRVALEAGNATKGNSPFVSYHCEQGVQSQLFTDNSYDCAVAFFGD